MLSVTGASVDEVFLRASKKIVESGATARPRGEWTLEVVPAHLTVEDPMDCVVSFEHRKHPYRFMAMECVWVLSGNREPWIIDYLQAWDKFTDVVDGKKVLMGAYGPRIRDWDRIDQLQYVVEELTRDPSSRRAVVSIREPSQDTAGFKDVPCTCTLQFLIRDGRLNMVVHMRSNDLVRGWCTDAFNFCVIQCILASVLKVGVGQYYHYASSLHVYQRDISMVERILEDPSKIVPPVMSPKLRPVAYSLLSDAYSDASCGAALASTRMVPGGDGYLAYLLKWAASTLDSQPLRKPAEVSK